MYVSPISACLVPHVDETVVLIHLLFFNQAVARILETDPCPEEPLLICTDSKYTIEGELTREPGSDSNLAQTC